MSAHHSSGTGFKDISGRRFGRLVALRRAGRKGKKATWLCQCDCGKTTVVVGTDIRSGNTQSCGCQGGRVSWEPIQLGGGLVGVPLTRGAVAVVDGADLPLVRGLLWGLRRGRRGGTYAGAWRGGVRVLMHRLILGAKPGDVIDHANGDGLDNRRCNLRFCTQQQNSCNGRPRGGTSQFHGVCWASRRRRWLAMIRTTEGRKNLGEFSVEEDAARAYDGAARKYHGEFARLNFPG